MTLYTYSLEMTHVFSWKCQRIILNSIHKDQNEYLIHVILILTWFAKISSLDPFYARVITLWTSLLLFRDQMSSIRSASHPFSQLQRQGNCYPHDTAYLCGRLGIGASECVSIIFSGSWALAFGWFLVWLLCLSAVKYRPEIRVEWYDLSFACRACAWYPRAEPLIHNGFKHSSLMFIFTVRHSNFQVTFAFRIDERWSHWIETGWSWRPDSLRILLWDFTSTSLGVEFVWVPAENVSEQSAHISRLTAVHELTIVFCVLVTYILSMNSVFWRAWYQCCSHTVTMVSVTEFKLSLCHDTLCFSVRISRYKAPVWNPVMNFSP
jgi:hypothetical protein